MGAFEHVISLLSFVFALAMMAIWVFYYSDLQAALR